MGYKHYRLKWHHFIYISIMQKEHFLVFQMGSLQISTPWQLARNYRNRNIYLMTPGGVTVCLAAFAETQLRCRKRSCAQLVQLRAANAASAARAPIRSTIGSMGPQKPNEQYIERRWRSRRSQRSQCSQRSQRSWCSCAQPTQPAHPELQFEVL